MRVSYDKDFREQALAEQRGLATIEVIAPGKEPGKRGGRVTTQLSVTQEEAEEIRDFAQKFWSRRDNGQDAGSKSPERPC